MERGNSSNADATGGNLTGDGTAAPSLHHFSVVEKCVNLPVSLLCLAALGTFCRLIHRRIDTDHPVYALLAHCVVVQTVLQTVNVVTNVLRSYNSGPTLCTAAYLTNFLVTVCLRQFYEITWACVSYLRYRFIRQKEFIESMDFAKMRRAYLRLLWGLFALQMAVVFVMLGVLQQLVGPGGPQKWAQRPLLVRIGIVVPSHMLCIWPDLFSVVTYFRLRHLVRKKKKEDSEMRVRWDAAPYGGIYVGSVDSYNPDEESQQPKPPDSGKTTSDKEIKCVLTALKTYSLTCLVDLLILSQRVIIPEFGIVDIIKLQIWDVWIPMATIAINFGTLRSVVRECLKSLVPRCCSKNEVSPEP